MLLTYSDFCKHLETKFTWSPFLKTTFLCDDRCQHCCECAGPDREQKFIELTDIKYILEQFKNIKNFKNIVTITGGEPMMAYTKKSEHYIPTLLKYCGKNRYDVCLNTNANWTLDKNAEQIFSDLEEFVVKYKRKITFFLSLDNWHKNAVNANAEFVNWIAKNNKIADKYADTYILFDHPDITEPFINKLAEEYNVVLTEIITDNPLNGSIFKFKDITKRFCFMMYNGITEMGRAKENNIATQKPFSKTEIYFSPYTNTENEICFDCNGNAMLSACDDDTIKTPYHDKNGKMKSLATIKQELFNMAYQRYLSENQI